MKSVVFLVLLALIQILIYTYMHYSYILLSNLLSENKASEKKLKINQDNSTQQTNSKQRLVTYQHQQWNKNKINIEQIMKNYSKNYEFVINNNIAQYSSYIIVDRDDTNYEKSYRIEALVKYNTNIVKDFGGKINFTCLVQLFSTDGNEEIIELEAFEMPLLIGKLSAKLIFKLNPRQFSFYKHDSSTFDLNRILIAIIWNSDYDKNLKLKDFFKSFNTHDRKIVLPYCFIKFQIPTVIQTQNPRISKVGLCIHYTYQIPSFILNWIDYQLKFGFHQIMFYDATDDSVLTKMIQKFYSAETNKQLFVRPYYMTSCEDIVLFKNLESKFKIPTEIKKFLILSCQEFSKYEFSLKYRYRGNHESLTVNDCYTVFRQKYEYIAHFDLDEVIFSRKSSNFDDFYKINNIFKCNDTKKICQLKPFKNDFKSNKSNDNFIYNYIKSLIEKYRNGQNLNKLSSIYFQNAVYLSPDIEEKKLMKEIDSIIKTNSINKKYPIKIYLSTPPYNQGHTFTIEKDDDIQYIIFLSNMYNTFIKSCVFNEYLNKSDKIHRHFLRYLYFVSEPEERAPKAIHYYKNVNTIFIHRGIDFVKGHWSMYPDILNGHYLAHFRESNHWLYNTNSTGPINKLNIDYEYLFFMLNNLTNYC